MSRPRSLLARKRLIATVLVLAALVGLSILANLGTVAQIGTTTAVVGIAKTPTTSPTNAEIDVAVRQAVALAGGLPAFDAGKKIVIHPNLVEAGWTPNNGVTTNLQVLKTLVDMCVEAGAARSNITICEGSAGFHGPRGSYTVRQMTWKSFSDYAINTIPGVNLVDANDCGTGNYYPNYPGYTGGYSTANHFYYYQTTPPPNTPATRMSNLWIDRMYAVPKCVVQCDYLISVPCLKNHDTAGTTGGLKLGFGFAPADIFHYDNPTDWLGKWNLLHKQAWGQNEVETNARGMVDINLIRKPDLVVMDGLIGITTGPTREPLGTASPYMACIIASTDIVALDSIATLAMGYRIDSVISLDRGATKGLGTNDPGKIEVRGYHVKDIRRWFTTPYGCAVRGDGTAPTLGGLTVPDGVHVCGQLTVGPTGHFDLSPGLCKGELYIDGILADSNDSSATTYKTSWLVTNQSDGAHTLTYTLYDKMLNETSLSRTVYLHRGNPITQAQALPDGTNVSVGALIYTGATAAIDGNTFFVSSPDGLQGMRVRYGGAAPSLTPGQKIAVYGTLSSTGGQRYLNCLSYTVYEMGNEVRPRYFRNKALGGVAFNGYTPGVYNPSGPYNLGCLVKTAGRVLSSGSGYFFISDGSVTTRRDGINGIKVQCGSIGQPAIGSYVTVVGLSCCEDDGSVVRRMLVVRSASDIVTQ